MTEANNVMKRFFASATIATAGALALAACGTDGGAAPPDPTDAATGPAPESTVAESTAGDGSAIVTVVEVDGLGEFLADATGRVLYVSDEEADGEVLCTDDACVSFWVPLEAGPDAPTGPPGITDLDVVERPDGTRQVTHDGRPLYTFTVDAPGEVTGDGLSDEFGGQRLTWRAVFADGTTNSPVESTVDTVGPIYDSPGDDGY